MEHADLIASTLSLLAFAAVGAFVSANGGRGAGRLQTRERRRSTAVLSLMLAAGMAQYAAWTLAGLLGWRTLAALAWPPMSLTAVAAVAYALAHALRARAPVRR